MSRLEDALAAGRFVVTSELLSVDSGGLEAVHERFAPYEDYVDATNATDNTSAQPASVRPHTRTPATSPPWCCCS